jgi:cytochrome c-type biogenesis protein CcmE
VELSPLTTPDPSPVVGRRRRSPLAYGVLVAVLVGVGIVTYQGLTSASLYFYNADEAVEQKADLGDRRFRLQGSVLDGVRDTAEGVAFTVRFNDVEVDVRHDGDPPELFEPGLPVVLEGRWDASGDVFESDRILVKHSEEYQADNGERLVDAVDGDTDRADTP